MAPKSVQPLKEELTYYDEQKHDWLSSHAGEFVLISARSNAGFFPSYEAALKAGVKTYGVGKQFLIKQVVEHEPVFVIY